jgi:TPR repeat protein
MDYDQNLFINIDPIVRNDVTSFLDKVDESTEIDKCKSGKGDSCLEIGFSYYFIFKFDLANDYFKMACTDFKEGLGCFFVGKSFYDLEDYELAEQYFKNSCDLNYGSGCWEYLLILAQKKCEFNKDCDYKILSEDKDFIAKAMALLRKACKYEDDVACEMLKEVE